ncbi:hypothetical protein [Labedaea rhizosphaerae]|uniref:RecA DNA recombination protein n=1 Tax=Labedaea rhizosphaerae TaxID=598644 RepID=A0A4R6SHZ6_LABRH|nr:hypothetical protein [Labedaea rhizosphaerae]TDQ00578.1 recA DNA recombination protein [Labedaea rhizosphaerae]
MKVKLAGETRLRSGNLGDLALRIRWSDKLRALPLTTGWHALDLGMGGGIPRRTIVAVGGTDDEQLRDFVYALVGHRQAQARPVAVVDMTADFTARKTSGTPVDYRNLTVVRTDKVDEAIEAAQRLIDDDALDFVLLHAPDLDETIRATHDPWIDQLLRTMGDAVRHSRTAGMVNLGRAVPSQEPLTSDSMLVRMTRSGKVTVKAPGHDLIPLDLATTTDARPAKAADLVTGGLMTNLVELAGGTFRFGGVKVRGRQAFEFALDNDKDAALSLEGQLTQQVRQLWLEAPEAVGAPDEPGDEVSPAARPGFKVNTWFVADRTPLLPLVLNQPYELNLRIGIPELHEGGWSQELKTMPEFHDDGTVTLVATVYGKDFAVAERTKTFTLHRDRGSDLVTFAVQPRRAGWSALQIAISTATELELLHELELRVPTATAEQAEHAEAV